MHTHEKMKELVYLAVRPTVLEDAAAIEARTLCGSGVPEDRNEPNILDLFITVFKLDFVFTFIEALSLQFQFFSTSNPRRFTSSTLAL